MDPLTGKVLVKGGTTALGRIKEWLDPNVGLRASIESYHLEESPRIFGLLQALDKRLENAERTAWTAEDIVIITQQVIEMQLRTFDQEKRKRLTNVLINGFTSEAWDKVKHRLMIRMTAELEEEHIDRLRRYTMDAHQLKALSQDSEPYRIDREYQERLRESIAVQDALRRELISRGLLHEETKTKLKMQRVEVSQQTPVVENVELVSNTSISRLGLALLEYLKDPPPSDSTT